TYLYRFKHAKREDAFRLLSCLAISHPLQLTMSHLCLNAYFFGFPFKIKLRTTANNAAITIPFVKNI
ncbi:MAG: hypothetical protein EGQ80_10185, partial [Streptococcus lutetiensis]|nr:hypothetical protein [Streptococcus lutetiensis]